MSLVLDSSATLAWILADETTDAVNQVFDAIIRDGAWVPAIWRLEVANGLQVAVRRGRISAPTVTPRLAISRISQLPQTKKPIAMPDLQRCDWQSALASRCTTQLISNSRSAGDCRWRHWDQDLRAAAGVLNVELLGIAY